MSRWYGFKFDVRGEHHLDDIGPCVLVCNHQNTLDLVVAPKPLRRGTVSIGKKSLKWIPVFGLFYWITGNIMIDRKNSNKAADTLNQAAEEMMTKKLSVWMFPEGTRSYGRGLLPFKTGAFRLAKQVGVPIVPVCVSDTHELVNLNRWNNGVVPIEVLPPVYIDNDADIRKVANEIHDQMAATIARITHEVKGKS
ncbi:lysophospholipid acyltransferase family protein [Echinimonas agarilytica]|uniref:1-acyl-sn-glycerol-3-phosphate acyltransferase n=1 Tax=Echinimonas agarilytica TaxID=1215918 RepID=A0AA41W826_9GAMM|nr:1-acylglycerol-3-phosphate O-acyltransferase [Echinimonas agarilytica]MCM2680398.1 1-acylglycerol-3-phosphate O-acyltransferase [Echinimonas agarilytica]